MGRGWLINRASIVIMVALSLIALVTVLTGYMQQPQADEGTSAHIFQLSIAGLAVAALVFLASADWKRPWQSTRPLLIPAGLVILAFTALYYLEHVYYVRHYR